MKSRWFLLFLIILISFFGCKDVSYSEDYEVNIDEGISKVTVNFKNNGGQGEMPSQKFEKSVTTQLNKNIFTKLGYKFTNWNTASDGSGQNFEDCSFVKFDSDMTLYAMWLPEDAVVYKVQHYQQNLKDDNYTLLETEYKEGLNSNKVSESPREYQGFYVKDIQLSNEGTFVKVYYDRNIFTITLNTNDGIIENPEITVKYGDCLDSNLKPIKEGFYFVGWYTDENFTNLFDFSTIIDKDYTLFAKLIESTKYTCTSSNVGTVIGSLSGKGPHYVKVTGAITSSTINSIRKAMINNSSALVILDLSETTGLTRLYCTSDNYYYNFYYVYNLIEVKLPESVTSIGDSTFSSCTSLKSIYIPSSVTTIALDAFKNAPLEEIIVSPDNPNYMAIDNCLYTKDGSTLIKASAKTEIIVLSSEVTSINYAFYNCDNLQSIELPESVTNIESYAFYSCDNLQSIKLPESVTKIGDYVFYNCKKLSKIDFSENITSIGEYAFYNCRKLQNIDFGNKLESIGSHAFEMCLSFTQLILPETIKSIDSDAFYDCLLLEYLKMPMTGWKQYRPSSPNTYGYNYSWYNITPSISILVKGYYSNVSGYYYTDMERD